MEKALRVIRVLLDNNPAPSQSEIDSSINKAAEMFNIQGDERIQLKKEVLSVLNIWVPEFRTIEATQRKIPWINEKRSHIKWEFWNRYRTYLKDDKLFPDAVINQVDILTDRVLDGLFYPLHEQSIRKYGMVVGQVQSGKTSNYTGLICKAADSGFKLIIVLAGIHNSLRSQTQLRLDEGFLGFDTKFSRAYDQNRVWIGVGRGSRSIVAHSLTSSDHRGDFTAGAANSLGINFNTTEPILLVVKKNAAVLQRLKKWLSTYAVNSGDKKIISDKSLLMIDDEADHASINTNPRQAEQPTRINGLITDIMTLFSKAAYVGYTATPFANIFIPLEEDSLFPRDFIINIPAPSNYIGPDKVFGFDYYEDDSENNKTLPIVFRIDDYKPFFPDRHQSQDPKPQDIPESLNIAIKTFFLVCTIRQLRGNGNAHNSMLIHVSRFIAWQNKVFELVYNTVRHYQRGIEFKIPDIIEEFRQIYEVGTQNYDSIVSISQEILESEFASLDTKITTQPWIEVLSILHEASSKIVVKELNGGSGDVLDYYEHTNGLSLIAIGGDKLSRGLTLEGLSVSYFLRSSKMYDTLMQMGRWFGYKRGFLDLCRLFTSAELNEWFCHITKASEELRDEFDYMSNVANATPEKFALKVRTHPGQLQISASNKIRTAKHIEVSWAGRLIETYQFLKSEDEKNENLLQLKEFASVLSLSETKSGKLLWFDIKPESVMNFLSKLKYPENLKSADTAILTRFIEMQLKIGELKSWRVAIFNKSNTRSYYEVSFKDKSINIGLYLRNCDEKIDQTHYYLKKSHIISPPDELVDLTDEEKKEALRITKEYRLKSGKNGEIKSASGQVVRDRIRNPQNPLLMIYLLDPDGAIDQRSGISNTGPLPFLGYAISFPKSKFNVPVKYAINEQLLPQFEFDYIEDDMNFPDDDEY